MAVYPFNNKTGVNDVSPYKGEGISEGTLFSLGIHGELGGSIEVQGHADSYIELTNTGHLDTKVSITILLYVYPLGSSGPIVNYKRDGHGVQIYETSRGGKGSLGARINPRDSVGYQPEVRKDRILRFNEWQFIGVTYNGSSGVVNLWHEGQAVASRRYDRLADIATQFDVRIGTRQGSTGECFSGRLACLQFYSTALTVLQIEKARIACKPCKYKKMLVIKINYLLQRRTNCKKPYELSPLLSMHKFNTFANLNSNVYIA